MFIRLNPWVIIVDHAHSFRAFNSGAFDKASCFLFIAMPVATGLTLALWSPSLVASINCSVVDVSSIFVALLLNLQVMVASAIDRLMEQRDRLKADPHYGLMIKQGKISDNDAGTMAYLLECMTSNTSFAVLNAVLLIILSFFVDLDMPFTWMKTGANATLIGLCTLFVMTLLMILQRVHRYTMANIDFSNKWVMRNRSELDEDLAKQSE